MCSNLLLWGWSCKMTTQSTTATLLGRSGKIYTFENTAVTDGTAGEEMLSGPSHYALTAQSFGD